MKQISTSDAVDDRATNIQVQCAIKIEFGNTYEYIGDVNFWTNMNIYIFVCLVSVKYEYEY